MCWVAVTQSEPRKRYANTPLSIFYCASWYCSPSNKPIFGHSSSFNEDKKGLSLDRLRLRLGALNMQASAVQRGTSAFAWARRISNNHSLCNVSQVLQYVAWSSHRSFLPLFFLCGPRLAQNKVGGDSAQIFFFQIWIRHHLTLARALSCPSYVRMVPDPADQTPGGIF